MSKKLPSIARRPSGFTEAMQEAILKTATAVTANGVKAVFEEDTTHPDYAFAKEWLEGKPLDIEWVWWTLQRRDVERLALEALGGNIQPQEPGEDEIGKACAMLRKRFVYGAFRNEVFDIKAHDWIMTKALDNLLAHKMPSDDKGRRYSAFELLRNDRKALRVHNERYMPGKDGLIVERDGIDWLNTWERPTIQPVKGTAKPMLDHILYLCNGNKEHAGHIADWLAYLYQNPGAKMSHALLLISPSQGVGKDTLAEAMMRVLGIKNVQFVQDDNVNEGRNEFMKRAQLVVVPETMSGDRKDLANKLKPLITQPVVRINEKNVKPYDTENTVNFLMFSNHENAAHIEDQDRRYFVIICRQKPRSVAYYDDLYDNYIRSDAVSGFAHFLATRDLSAFNPKAPAPWTEDKQTVQQATRGGVEAWLDDAWESRAAPFNRDVINLREALTRIQEMKGPRMTVQQIAGFLKKNGGGDLGKRRIHGDPTRIWAVRNFDDIQSRLDEKIAELKKDEDGLFGVVSVSEHEERVVALRK